VVTCYLVANINLKLERKLLAELPGGVRLVSNTLSFPGM
jgi:hypothetical protein